jgi:hypothetical protein
MAQTGLRGRGTEGILDVVAPTPSAGWAHFPEHPDCDFLDVVSAPPQPLAANVA